MKKNYQLISIVKSVWKSKILMTMRATLFVVLISVTQAFATSIYSQNTRLTLNLKNTSVKQILGQIEDNSEFYFIYDATVVDVERKASLESKNELITEVLDEFFKGLNVGYKINDRQIALTTLVSSGGTQEQKTVTGKVVDLKGLPLPGVTVVVKGTTNGIVTNANGEYTLSGIHPDDVLQFSFVGMKTKETTVGSKTTINITMEEEAIGIEEVIAVGYGTQKKSDLTGSITSVKVSDLQERPAVSLIEKMQGKATGVDIVQNSGTPGSIPTIRIRGNRSFSASNDPLYVVDGIPLEGGINDINPNDIISIEVLKDAASCAIYGSRGANGVILVTTKRGSASKTNISYNTYYGVSQISRMVDMMNAEEFAEYRREAYRATNSYIDDEHLFETVQLENLRNGISYDYPEMIFSQGYKTDHQLSFSGGNDKTQFALSGGYYDEKGTIKNMYYKRYTLRLNLDHRFTDWFKVGTSTLLTRSLNDVGTTAAVESALLNSPIGQAFDLGTGEPVFLPTTDGQLSNPLFDIESENFTDEYKINRVFSSVYAEIDFLKYLNYRLNFGIDNRDQRRGLFRGSYTDSNLGGASDATVENTGKFTYTLENILKFSKNFDQKHQVDFTLMQSVQSFSQEYYGFSVNDLPYETQKFYNMDTGSTVLGVDSQLEEWKMASFMGRINYDYNGKYLIQGTLRADGSSRLSEGKKWGYFPSGALGWRIINEPWMQDLPFISNLKLRASYGVTGNTAINAYQTQGALAQTVYDWDGSPGYGYALNDIPNPDLRWESTATIDAGVDFGILKGRINGSVDYYNAKTSDLLMLRQLPITSGYSSILENVGSTRNKGIEINLNTIILDNPKGITWKMDVNWFANREEILELYDGRKDDVGNNWFIGQPLSVFYDYEKIGIWQSNEKEEAASYGFFPGEIKIKDQEPNGVIDSDDRVIRGSSVPKWNMGITNRFEYKGLDLSCFVFIRQGSTIYSRFHHEFSSLAGRYNNLDVDYWTPDNPTNAYPRPNQNQNYARYDSSNNYFDGSFVKIRNITLGYTIPKKLIDAVKINSVRVYVTADNPFMFTKYEGWDPENDKGILYYDVPNSKAIVFGLNVNF